MEQNISLFHQTNDEHRGTLVFPSIMGDDNMKDMIIISLTDILCIMIYGVSVNMTDRTLKTILRYLTLLLLIFTGSFLNRFNVLIVMMLFAIINAASVIVINYFNKRNKVQIKRKHED
jgi:hypothetical protein